MTQQDKERIEKENEWIKNAWEVWEEDQKHHTQPVNPHAYVHGFVEACKAIEKQLKQERNKAIDGAIEVAYNHDVIDNWYQLKLKLESLKH